MQWTFLSRSHSSVRGLTNTNQNGATHRRKRSTLEQQAHIPESTVNKTAYAYMSRIAITDLTVQMPLLLRFGDKTSVDCIPTSIGKASR